MLNLLRRVDVAGLAIDDAWGHSSHTDQDWLDRGFTLDSDGSHGARIPPGKDGRMVGMVVRAEDAQGDEVAGTGTAQITVALVQLLELRDGATITLHYRQRQPLAMTLGDLVGAPDILRAGVRLFPRIVALPVGLDPAVTQLAFFVGVL